MAKNITLMGANYPNVPAVELPQTGGGSAMFIDADEMDDIEDSIAIVIDGNNAPKAITKGKYLFIKNHTTLPNGGYHATANIANGDSVTSNNTLPDADGIVNGLYSRIESLFITDTISFSFDSSTLVTEDVPQHAVYKPICVVGTAFAGGINSAQITVAYLTDTRLRLCSSNTTATGCTATVGYIRNI